MLDKSSTMITVSFYHSYSSNLVQYAEKPNAIDLALKEYLITKRFLSMRLPYPTLHNLLARRRSIL